MKYMNVSISPLRRELERNALMAGLIHNNMCVTVSTQRNAYSEYTTLAQAQKSILT